MSRPEPLVDPRLLANPDHVASAVTSISGADRGQPQRAIDVRVLGGIDLRVLPDRGLDLSGAWFAGVPLHWTSRVGEVRPREDLSGTRWLEGFGGGLLTTCGLRNVGAPAEGHGLHGTFSHLPARDVTITRSTSSTAGTAGRPAVTVRATIIDADALGTSLRCERSITTAIGEGRLTVRDTVTNSGSRPEPAPMLYHVNIGAPLWSPGTTVDIDSRHVVPRDAEAARHEDTMSQAPEPVADGAERVVEHVGASVARVVNVALGLTLTVTWDTSSMPRLHQWVHPGAGVYVLGIEPANCSVLGRSHDRAEDRLPVLQPGESRATTLHVTVTR